MTRESTRISWRMLTGNKFRRDLLPEMFSASGCIKEQNIRKTGDSRKSIFDVYYDREYGLEMLIRKVVKPLFVLGKEEVLKLVSEAWDTYEKEVTVQRVD
jgi:hypothetical protein